MNALNILRKTCSLICILLLCFVGGLLICPIGLVIGHFTFPWIGHIVNGVIGWSVGGSSWFMGITDSIWNFKYD